ncbi:amidohydrolase [Planctomicrobium sp. SH664]|uniref:amidohydrolase n=1 Tax=Planctomicrobium sp. SH664 TaxID=3448125 RepID=UPI003F5BD4A4
MKLPHLFIASFLLLASNFARAAEDPIRQKIDARVGALTPEGWQHACQIWDWAETGYQETKSSALLADWLEKEGFRVERGVAGIPTAFTATIGSGSPVIAILGEYDALPGLAQAAVPYQEQPEGKYYGHGCGHHLFGVASAMAAISLGEQIKSGQLKGTVRFYGCPAEEGGSGKTFLVREGLFKDADVCLHWHPSAENSWGTKSSLARMAAKFRFYGKSAHAAGAPHAGRSALDAVEIMNYAVNMMREHVKSDARIHYVITAGGDAPNVVPNFAEVYYYIRHPQSIEVRSLYERVLNCAKAGALATDTRLEINYEGGIVEVLPNTPLAELTGKNLKAYNKLSWTDADRQFAAKIAETLPARSGDFDVRKVTHVSGGTGGGSTDVGDVSWVVPTAGFGTSCWVPGSPGHSWQVVAAGTQDMARGGMVLAAQTLAGSGYELLTRPELIDAAKADFKKRNGGEGYSPLILPDQKPPLDYRKRPAATSVAD